MNARRTGERDTEFKKIRPTALTCEHKEECDGLRARSKVLSLEVAPSRPHRSFQIQASI